MSEFKTWDELTVLEQYACQYSDMHKDAYGFRPRGVDTSGWTEEQFLEEFKILGAAIENSIAEEKAWEEKAIEIVENRIRNSILTGAGDRETAVLWLHREYETNGDNDYLCYRLNLPFNYFN